MSTTPIPPAADSIPVRGAIILPTPDGPKVFTLTMENPETITPDDIFSGEPTFISRMRGQMPGPDVLEEHIKYQTSMWRFSSNIVSIYTFTNYLFLNECIYPMIGDGQVKFKLLTAKGYVENIARNTSRGDIVKYGDNIPTSGVLPNVECCLKASDFGWSGFLNIVRFKHEDSRKLEFDKEGVSVKISSVGVVLDKIPKIYRLPVHNMHDHGDWCFPSGSAVALKRNPFSQNPGALFHDLVHAPSNSDLEKDYMNEIYAEYFGSSDQETMPLFKLMPGQNFEPSLINMSLPPIWDDIVKFNA